MQGCYYTVCSLPSLSFAAPPPLTAPAFLSLCEIEVCRESMRILNAVSLLPPRTTPPLSAIERWYGWERRLRQELARIRAATKLSGSSFKIRPGSETSFSRKNLAARAMALESPAEAENLLDLSRWRFLSELETANHFGLQKLGLYFLKLQLLERRALFSQATGQKIRLEILNRVALPAVNE